MGVRAVRRSDTERRKMRSQWNVQEKTTTQHKRLQLLGIIILLHGQKFLSCTGTYMHTQMDKPKNADSNCC